MRTQQIFCNKCEKGMSIIVGEMRISTDFRFNSGVSLSQDIDLCYLCTWEFINWLKGETIDKQTQTIKPKLWCPKSSNKTLILEMLHKADNDGMSIGEILRCNREFKRRTISPQLSRWAKEGLVVNRSGRHYLIDYT